MASGRQQKWTCKDCKATFSVQHTAPKFCCSCGSSNIGRIPSYELAISYELKENALRNIVRELNPVHKKYSELKSEYDQNIMYWRKQCSRGYITKEQLQEYIELFDGAKKDT